MRRMQLLERKMHRKRRELAATLAMHKRRARRRVLVKRQSTIRWWHRQYQFNDAARDVRIAYRRNEDIMLGLLILGYFLIYVAVSNGADILYYFSQAVLMTTVVFGWAIAPLLLLVLAGVFMGLLWMLMVVMSAVQGSVMESLVRKRYRSLRIALKRSVKGSGRMVVAWLLLAALVCVPLGLATMLVMSAMMFGFITPDQFAQYGQYGVIVALLWPIYCAMHYALIPTIAHFQPRSSWKSVIAQSHELVRRKGRVFLLLLHMAILTGFCAVYGIAWAVNAIVPVGVLGVTVFGCFALTLVYQAVLTLLYYRRRRSW